MRGATMYPAAVAVALLCISTHTPHAGRDVGDYENGDRCTDFYSHAPCGARLDSLERLVNGVNISTHTPHAGRDKIWPPPTAAGPISTHTPHAGRDIAQTFHQQIETDFYSHAPCGARQFEQILQKCILTISTHTPHAGRDSDLSELTIQQITFLLTRPMRGATASVVQFASPFEISTHTPHAGCDCLAGSSSVDDHIDFYSHAPCGARPYSILPDPAQQANFYSHAPCGARPQRSAGSSSVGHFYSHAPCGARPSPSCCRKHGLNFYSHAPCGARHHQKRTGEKIRRFLLTRPMRGATCPVHRFLCRSY